MRKAALVVVAALGLVVVAQAGAHAEITPKKVPAGGVSTFVLSVEAHGPSSAPTVKIAMRLPPGMANVKPANDLRWQVNLGARVITWTGEPIPQGQTGWFEITGQFPNSPGRTLKFPTVQTYRDGTVVRWIGAPASDTPAPTITLTAAAQAPPPPPPPVTTTTTGAPSQNEDDDGGSTGWIVGAVIVVVLVGSGAALLWRRRR